MYFDSDEKQELVFNRPDSAEHSKTNGTKTFYKYKFDKYILMANIILKLQKYYIF